jgi:para-nitrobenzyl esterase
MGRPTTWTTSGVEKICEKKGRMDMPEAIVETAFGKVRGRREGNVFVWKGIPYAKAPVGPLRFRPPEPPDGWSGIREATQYGDIPWQSEDMLKLDQGSVPCRMSEDCLNLNVWSPAPDGRKRPVMVWIYGGSYISGSGNFPGYSGASFAELGDVVFVTINYRLGMLGFLHLGEIAGEEYATTPWILPGRAPSAEMIRTDRLPCACIAPGSPLPETAIRTRRKSPTGPHTTWRIVR